MNTNLLLNFSNVFNYTLTMCRNKMFDNNSVFDEFERVVSEEHKNKKFEITYKKTTVYTNTGFEWFPQGHAPKYENVDFLYFSIKFN